MHKIISILSFVVFLILSGTELFAVNSQDMQRGGRMPDSAANGAQTMVLIQPAFSLNTARMAVLIVDCENNIVNMLPENV
jgi:hypothetical protein